MNWFTLHNFIQVYVFILSALAVYCTARTDKWHRWGFVFGFASEPAWFYFAWITQSWGILLLTIWWSYSWATGAYRRFKLN